MAIRTLVAFLCGLVFSFGLILGGMLNPATVLGFLNLAGHWNPSLLFVLGGAVCLTFCGVRLQRHLSRPVFETTFQLPTARQIDWPLMAGSCLFGLGWGLAGFCPGPAVASLLMGHWQSLVFLLGLIGGMKAFALWKPD